jgi:hypothetical protein
MSERNAELLEIRLRQLRKNLEIYGVVTKKRLVLVEAQFAKPIPDFHVAPREMDLQHHRKIHVGPAEKTKSLRSRIALLASNRAGHQFYFLSPER